MTHVNALNKNLLRETLLIEALLMRITVLLKRIIV
jgi:hypothetical protein